MAVCQAVLCQAVCISACGVSLSQDFVNQLCLCVLPRFGWGWPCAAFQRNHSQRQRQDTSEAVFMECAYAAYGVHTGIIAAGIKWLLFLTNGVWDMPMACQVRAIKHAGNLLCNSQTRKAVVEWLVRVWSQGQGSQPKLLISEKAWTIPLLNEFEA